MERVVNYKIILEIKLIVLFIKLEMIDIDLDR